ncbi:MAG: hypothetical protein ACJAS9_000334 [Polaribacter sp.]|jgi:hypothetical protein
MLFNLSRIILVCIFIIASASCSFVPPTTSDYDVNYNFAQLNSYAWITKRSDSDKIESKKKDNTKVITLRQKRQKLAIESEMAKKGFNLLDSIGNADFLIKSHNVTDKKKDVNRFYSTWGYYPYYHSPYIWPRHISSSVEREYEIGTQVVDIVDAKSREVIWRGSVSQRLDFYKNQTPEQRNQKIFVNVGLMLKSFPPKLVK